MPVGGGPSHAVSSHGEGTLDERAGVLDAIRPREAANADDLASLDDDDVPVLTDDGALLGGPPGGADQAGHALLSLAALLAGGAGHDGGRGPSLASHAVEAGA